MCTHANKREHDVVILKRDSNLTNQISLQTVVSIRTNVIMKSYLQVHQRQ